MTQVQKEKGDKGEVIDVTVRASYENPTQKGGTWLKLLLQDPNNPDGDAIEAKCFESDVISQLLGQAGVATYEELKGNKVSFNGEWDVYNEKGSWKIKSAIKQNPITATPDTQTELTEAKPVAEQVVQQPVQSKFESLEDRAFNIAYHGVFNNSVIANSNRGLSGALPTAEERAKHFDPTIFSEGVEDFIPPLFQVFVKSKKLMREAYDKALEEAKQAEAKEQEAQSDDEALPGG